MGLTRERLVDSYGLYYGRRYTENFEDAFRKFFEKNQHMMPNEELVKHGINPVFVLALHQVLQERKISITELKEHVLAIYNNMLKDYLKRYQVGVEASENPWSIIVQVTKDGNRENYENQYFNLSYVNETADELGFDINKCFYFDILKANGHPELGPILCAYDHILMDAISQWVRFERTETIADGYSRCDFRLYRL